MNQESVWCGIDLCRESHWCLKDWSHAGHCLLWIVCYMLNSCIECL